MRKHILFILALFMLAGCTKTAGFSEEVLQEKLDAVMNEPVMTANYGKDYVSYYLQPRVGRRRADRVSNVFVLNRDTFYMTLDIASVINGRYYEDQPVSGENLPQEALISRVSGSFGTEEAPVPYSICVYRIDDRFFVTYRGGNVSMAGSASEAGACEMAAEMLRIGRSVTVDREALIASFSRKELITYQARKVELFTNIAPESGEIEELFSDHYSAGSTGSDENGVQKEKKQIITDDTE